MSPKASAGTDYKIRVRGAAGALVNNGRVYSFTLPAECSSNCSAAYTKVSYTTAGTGPTTTPTTTATTTTTTPAPSGGCTATVVVTNSWLGGYQVEFTVRSTGSSVLSGWTTAFSFTVAQQQAST
jgi:cellulase/cellobiase CelA1